MILVDTALRRRAEEGRPARLAIVGAGTVGTKVTRQVFQATPGMQVGCEGHIETASTSSRASRCSPRG